METAEKVTMETLGHFEQTGVPYCFVTKLFLLLFLSGISVAVPVWITLEAFTVSDKGVLKERASS